jgi:hypothetical protein
MTSQSLLTQLDALRKTTLDADGRRQGSFSELFHAFLDIADDPALLNASKPTKDATLKGAIEACARQLTGNSAMNIQQVQMLRIDKAGFIHGSFFAGASIGSFFYFEKDRQGLVAYDKGGGVTLFSRISLVELPKGSVPVQGPPAGSRSS